MHPATDSAARHQQGHRRPHQVRQRLESEVVETPDTPLNIRAIGIFNRLQDAGWFKDGTVGDGANGDNAPGRQPVPDHVDWLR